MTNESGKPQRIIPQSVAWLCADCFAIDGLDELAIGAASPVECDGCGQIVMPEAIHPVRGSDAQRKAKE